MKPPIFSYNLHTDTKFRSYNAKKVHYSTETLYLGPKIWNLVPPEIKKSEALEIFRKKS